MPKYSIAEILAAFRAEGIECEAHELGLAAHTDDPVGYARVLLKAGTTKRAQTPASAPPPAAKAPAKRPTSVDPARWLTLDQAALVAEVALPELVEAINARQLSVFLAAGKTGRNAIKLRRADVLRWRRQSALP